MNYVLLIYQAKDYAPKELSEADHKAVAAGYAAINAMDNVQPGLPLGLATEAITVRLSDGKVTAARGTVAAGSGDSVGGYYVLEADSDEEAIRVASMIPAVSQGGAVEIRPSKVYW